ncbi:hypothetical protein MMC14_009223, partial [Varicellaria rhodocarpa]|nr:hypothetical protein [Varicellaria rhodocarpa]
MTLNNSAVYLVNANDPNDPPRRLVHVPSNGRGYGTIFAELDGQWEAGFRSLKWQTRMICYSGRYSSIKEILEFQDDPDFRR